MRGFILAIAVAVASPAMAEELLGRSGDLVVTDGLARAAPGARSGAGYFVITNRGTAEDRLIVAESAAADRVEFHTHRLEDGIARMVEVEDGFPLAPGESVALAQGRDHLMFMGLTEAWDPDGVPVRLVFERADPLEIVLPVAAGPGHVPGHGHGHDQGEDGDHSGHGGHQVR